MGFFGRIFGGGGTAARERDALIESLLVRERQIRARMIRESDDVFDKLVDPREEFEGWELIGGGVPSQGASTAAELDQMREKSRRLVFNNGFARNFVWNMENYVGGGAGFTYSFRPPKAALNGMAPASFAGIAELAALVWEEFEGANNWPELEREVIRVSHRDGDAFLRFFAGNGSVIVRKVDAADVADPGGEYPWGIVTDEVDEQRALAYIVDGDEVPASQIEHVRVGVDSDVLRGVPTLWCVRDQLLRAQKLLRNMSKVAEIQAAIAVIREHEGNISSTGIQALLDAQTQGTSKDPVTRQTINKMRIQEGSIVDSPAGVKWHFPAASSSLQQFVGALQAILRSIAASVNFPEFMFTADASNANFASTMVAVSPSVKTFEAWQAYYGGKFKHVVRRVLTEAVRVGRLPAEALFLRVDVTGPVVDSRDPVMQAQARSLDIQSGVLSVQTACAERGLDYEQEMRNREEHAARAGQMFPGLPEPEDDEDDLGDEEDPGEEPEEEPESSATGAGEA